MIRLLSVFLSFFALPVFAATYAPTIKWSYSYAPDATFTSGSAVCSHFNANFLNPQNGAVSTYVSASQFEGSCQHEGASLVPVYGGPVCLEGATLNDAGLCEGEEPCKSNQTRPPDGGACRCNAALYNGQAHGETWLSGSGTAPASLCSGGCAFSSGFGLGGGGSWAASLGSMTGDTCNADSGTDTPPLPKKQPPCLASEGVMTSSSGTVACVPEGTPNARKPVISKDKKTETFDDGSKKITETVKTTDPATNATHTSSSTTATPNSSGTAGKAGAPGTASSVAESSVDKGAGGDGEGEGEDNGNFCSENPNNILCIKGKTKEAGQFGSNEDKISEARQKLSDKFYSIKSEASGLFGTISGGAGSLPCPAPVVILGKPISFCFTDYQNELSVIGQVVMLIAAIASAFIIFRR